MSAATGDMRLRHFFENMVRREETASAFLATLLEYDPTFRRAFLRLVLDDPAFDDQETWSVRVEEERVDVTIESPTMLVLIEDKIGSGAKQHGQLLRYYLSAVETRSKKRIVAVYLAPGGIGIDEVDLVRRSTIFAQRESDVARHVPWGSVAELIDQQPQGEGAWFARSGMCEIERAIERARQERYPALGDRALVRGLTDNAVALLSSRCPDVTLGRWSGRDFEEILTNGTPVTVWLDAVFEVESEPPFQPIGIVRPDGIHLTIRSMFKLAGKVKRTSDLANQWNALARAGSAEVPGIGRHGLQPNKWFVHTVPAIGTAEDLEGALADTGQHLLEFLRPLSALSTDAH